MRLRVISISALTIALSASILTPSVRADVTEPSPATKAGTQVEKEPFSYLTPEAKQRMVAQEPLIKAADRIMDAVRSDKKDRGFAGLKLDDGFVQVWWKGEPPAAIRGALSSAKAYSPVRVSPAKYSLAELQAAAAPLREELSKNPGGPIHALGIQPDSSGLYALTDSGENKAGLTSTYPKLDAQVPTVVQQAPRGEFASRAIDSPPWWGGAQIVSDDTGARCTAGWPVHSTSNSNYHYILTAGHCGRPYENWRNGNRSRSIGRVVGENQGHDLLLIDAPDHVGNQIYDGGVPGGTNTTPEFSKSIAGYGNVYYGQWLCQSGAVSGAVCNYQVATNGQESYCGYDAFGAYECYNDLFVAIQYNGLPGSIKGDSGGPVFTPAGNTVIANGVISGRRGSDGLIFQDVVTAFQDFSVTIHTG
ncbi:trypsin-like serine protease [Microbispora sp. NPDC088329]|uniref:trypsin-like serine protease n=1 Tax=Microbispora sp. NPDC088329 TaxID=3154869 RepID=UPI003432BBB3